MGHLQQTYTVHFHDFWPTCPFHDLSETIFGNISLKKLVTSIIYHSNFFVWPKLASYHHSELESAKIGYFELFFSKMEKNVKFGQKFTPGEPNTFKNGSFCYLIFSKQFSLPISEKKFRWNSLIKYDWKINKKWILTPSGNHLPEKSETQKWRAVITNVHLERFKWRIWITSKFGKSNTPTCHGGWTSTLHDPNTCFSYVQKRHQYMGEIPM